MFLRERGGQDLSLPPQKQFCTTHIHDGHPHTQCAHMHTYTHMPPYPEQRGFPATSALPPPNPISLLPYMCNLVKTPPLLRLIRLICLR